MSGESIGPEPTNDEVTDPVKEMPAPEFTHFDTLIPTTYELPLDLQPAVVGPDESIETWLGPINKLGGSDVSSHYVKTGWSWRSTKEIDRDSINTLLFTSNQIIGLMLGPDDVDNLHDSSAVKSAANELVTRYQAKREGGLAKGVQFASLNANHWDDMVSALLTQPLEAALKNHLHCGLPYERVQSVEIKSRIINPGLTIRLTDGSYLWLGTFGKKDRLSDVANYLRSFVTVA